MRIELTNNNILPMIFDSFRNVKSCQKRDIRDTTSLVLAAQWQGKYGKLVFCLLPPWLNFFVQRFSWHNPDQQLCEWEMCRQNLCCYFSLIHVIRNENCHDYTHRWTRNNYKSTDKASHVEMLNIWRRSVGSIGSSQANQSWTFISS